MRDVASFQFHPIPFLDKFATLHSIILFVTEFSPFKIHSVGVKALLVRRSVIYFLFQNIWFSPYVNKFVETMSRYYLSYSHICILLAG